MSELLRRIVNTIKEYEQEKLGEIKKLENKLAGLEKEQELIIKHVQQGNIELLKTYFFVK